MSARSIHEYEEDIARLKAEIHRQDAEISYLNDTIRYIARQMNTYAQRIQDLVAAEIPLIDLPRWEKK